MKKLLSLLLTLAMLSTMFIVGATSVSAAAATTAAEEIVSPEVVYVNTAYTTETVTDNSTDPATETTHNIVTQTVKYYPNGTSQKLDYRYTSNKNWMYLKLPLNGLDSVTAVELYTYMRYNTQSTFYIRGLDKDVWTNATSGLVDNTKTLTTTDGVGDELFSIPNSGSLLDSLQLLSTSSPEDFTFDGTKKSVSVTDNKSTTRTGTTTGGKLVSYINDAAVAGEEYAYFAILFYPTQNKVDKGCQFDANKASFTLTGEKEIEGLGTKIIAEKTTTVTSNLDYVHYYNWQFTDTEKATYTDTTNMHKIIKNSTAEQQKIRSGITNPKGAFGRAYYSFDISGIANKEIVSVQLKGTLKGTSTKNVVTATRVTDLDTTFGALELNDGKNLLYETPKTPTVQDEKVTLSHGGSTSTYFKGDITTLVSAALKENSSTVDILVDNYRGDGKSETEGMKVDFSTPPTLTITYTEELAADETLPSAKTFKFKGEIATQGAQVRLLVGIYDSTGALIDVVASGVLTNGTDTLELPVDLSAYSTAASVKGYFWDGTTLNPFMQPTTANVAAATA